MADWLNALLAGPCTLTVLMDGEVVSDLASVGASLSTAGGLVSLSTPDDEAHDWEVRVEPTYLLMPTKFRLSSYDLTAVGPVEIDSAAVREYLRGTQVAETNLALPNFTPDPTVFTALSDTASLSVVEEDQT